jgi:transforming growth factor-beta-induced protein
VNKLSNFAFLLAVTATSACGTPQEPATADSAPTEAAPAPAEPAASNIVETAVDAGSFTTLVAAVKAAGLAETLSGPGPFTVFAPTDDAFAKLPAGTVDSLLKPENKAKLVAILTYHVVPGKLEAKDVVGSTKLKTVQGQELTVAVDGASVSIDGAKVVKTDVAASNGVIHVIDTVVLPKG